MSREPRESNWLPVVGFEKYLVSNLGHVWSLYTQKELKPYTHKWGHQEVKITKSGKVFSRGVHVLVAESFIGKKPPNQEVCHIDGNAKNNSVENLRYDTRQNNAMDSIEHGTHFQAKKTKCKHGHEFTKENTRNTKKGRVCKECHRRSERERRNVKRPKRSRS